MTTTASFFTGLSAFPLTPLRDDAPDLESFAMILDRLVASGPDSATVLGSTGSYAYLSRDERLSVIRAAAERVGSMPLLVGVGATRTKHVLEHARDAQQAGAAGLLVAPVSYQSLTEDDVYGLFSDVLGHSGLPVVVYDNPGTTHFTFSLELYGRLAALHGVASIKIPGIPKGMTADARLAQIRDVVAPDVTIGISGDAFAAEALLAGCEAWYSVIGGTLPEPALRITRAAQAGDAASAREASAAMHPLWDLFAAHGSIRVVAAIAEHLQLAHPGSLPLPIRGLSADDRAQVTKALRQAGLG